MRTFPCTKQRGWMCRIFTKGIITMMFLLLPWKLSSGPFSCSWHDIICLLCIHISMRQWKYSVYFHSAGGFPIWHAFKTVTDANSLLIVTTKWGQSLKCRVFLMPYRTIRPHNVSTHKLFPLFSPCSMRHWLSVSFDTLRSHCYQPDWKFIRALIWSSGIHHFTS